MNQFPNEPPPPYTPYPPQGFVQPPPSAPFTQPDVFAAGYQPQPQQPYNSGYPPPAQGPYFGGQPGQEQGQPKSEEGPMQSCMETCCCCLAGYCACKMLSDFLCCICGLLGDD